MVYENGYIRSECQVWKFILYCETWPRRRHHAKRTTNIRIASICQASITFFHISWKKCLVDLRLLISLPDHFYTRHRCHLLSHINPRLKSTMAHENHKHPLEDVANKIPEHEGTYDTLARNEPISSASQNKMTQVVPVPVTLKAQLGSPV